LRRPGVLRNLPGQRLGDPTGPRGPVRPRGRRRPLPGLRRPNPGLHPRPRRPGRLDVRGPVTVMTDPVVECPKCRGVGELYDAWLPRFRPDGWEREGVRCDWYTGRGEVHESWARRYWPRGRR